MKITLLLIVLLFASCPPAPPKPENRPTVRSQPSPPVAERPKLLLMPVRVNPIDESMAELHGEAKNISNSTIPDTVVASISVYDRKGRVLRTIRTSLDVSPLAPNQTSPFDVTISDIPGYATYKIEFRTLDGSAVQHIESKN